jgi:hypothetical protein
VGSTAENLFFALQRQNALRLYKRTDALGGCRIINRDGVTWLTELTLNELRLEHLRNEAICFKLSPQRVTP